MTIGHVQVERHRHAEFGQLGGKQKRAAQVLGVRHLQDRARRFGQQNIARHSLVITARRQRIRPRRVNEGDTVIRNHHRTAGDLDIATRQPAKHDRLANVRIADKNDRSSLAILPDSLAVMVQCSLLGRTAHTVALKARATVDNVNAKLLGNLPARAVNQRRLELDDLAALDT